MANKMTTDAIPHLIKQAHDLDLKVQNLGNQYIDLGMRIGDILHKIKATIRHGQFKRWCDENIRFSSRSCQRYMWMSDRRSQIEVLLAENPKLWVTDVVERLKKPNPPRLADLNVSTDASAPISIEDLETEIKHKIKLIADRELIAFSRYEQDDKLESEMNDLYKQSTTEEFLLAGYIAADRVIVLIEADPEISEHRRIAAYFRETLWSTTKSLLNGELRSALQCLGIDPLQITWLWVKPATQETNPFSEFLQWQYKDTTPQ